MRIVRAHRRCDSAQLNSWTIDLGNVDTMDKHNLKLAAAATAAASFLPVIGPAGTAAAIIGSIFVALQTAQAERLSQ
jgi:hypothetical protein